MGLFSYQLNLNKINNFEYIKLNEKFKKDLSPEEEKNMIVQKILNMYDEKELSYNQQKQR